MVEEFLVDLKKEFEGGDNEAMKIVELKKVEQRNKTMEEFVYEFRRVVRGSGYEERPLVEEFRKGINSTIWQRLIESEC